MGCGINVSQVAPEEVSKPGAPPSNLMLNSHSQQNRAPQNVVGCCGINICPVSAENVANPIAPPSKLMFHSHIEQNAATQKVPNKTMYEHHKAREIARPAHLNHTEYWPTLDHSIRKEMSSQLEKGKLKGSKYDIPSNGASKRMHLSLDTPADTSKQNQTRRNSVRMDTTIQNQHHIEMPRSRDPQNKGGQVRSILASVSDRENFDDLKKKSVGVEDIHLPLPNPEPHNFMFKSILSEQVEDDPNSKKQENEQLKSELRSQIIRKVQSNNVDHESNQSPIINRKASSILEDSVEVSHSEIPSTIPEAITILMALYDKKGPIQQQFVTVTNDKTVNDVIAMAQKKYPGDIVAKNSSGQSTDKFMRLKDLQKLQNQSSEWLKIQLELF